MKLCTGKNILFLILAMGVLALVWQMKEILLLFFAAYVIACALDPFVAALEKKNLSRTPAAAIVVGGSTLAVGALFAPIIFITVREIKSFLVFFPEKLSEITAFITHFKFMGYNLGDLINVQSLLSSSDVQGVFNRSLDFTIGIIQFVVIIIALLMIVYYTLIDKTYLKAKFIEFFPPLMKEKAIDISGTISIRLGNYVRVQLLSMASVGVMMVIVLALLRVDYPIFLGLITGVLDIIPILGPAIALFVILLVAYPASALKVALIIGLFILVQQLSNYVVRPVLFGKFMSVHPLIIFLALFIAQKFLGFWGVILSPALAATVCVLVDELYLKAINE
jgi:predicted PurR-regulated permease PerM